MTAFESNPLRQQFKKATYEVWLLNKETVCAKGVLERGNECNVRKVDVSTILVSNFPKKFDTNSKKCNDIKNRF